MDEGARITPGDASRVSIVIGIIIAVIATAVVLYFVFFAHSVKETMTGFDPNRPVPDDATLRKRLSPEQYHIVRENGTETGFKKPISNDSIVQRDDNSYDMHRIEVRAKRSDAHLGHLIQDPTSPTGQRYAVNSAALYFIPAEEMESAGYAAYKSAVPQSAQK